jgi:hypothetical protein
MALYNEFLPEFRRHHQAALAGISVDHAWSHIEFAKQRNLHFPLLADFHPKGEVAKRYGGLRRLDRESERALFVLDGDGVIRWNYEEPSKNGPELDPDLGYGSATASGVPPVARMLPASTSTKPVTMPAVSRSFSSVTPTAAATAGFT